MRLRTYVPLEIYGEGRLIPPQGVGSSATALEIAPMEILPRP